MLNSYTTLSPPPSTPPTALDIDTIAPPNSALTCRPQSSLKVLLVDDNPINLQLLRRALYTLFKINHMDMAYDGHQALKLLEHQPYDVILLDIDMPGMNGVDTARWIRGDQGISTPSSNLPLVLDANKTIPIVAVTTSDSLEARIIYQNVGMDACLSKPIIRSQLKSQLLQLLDHSSSSLISL
ncbi:unnamed protein product [Absidia cylindrospora]